MGIPAPVGLTKRQADARYQFAPLPVFAVFGDSISAQNTLIDFPNGTVAYNAKGDVVWLRALMGGRFRFPLSNVFGYSGQTSSVILTHLQEVIAAKPGFVRVLMGTNDPQPGVTWVPSATLDNIVTACRAFIAAGIVVMLVPILPKSSQGSLSSQEFSNAQKGFQWINRQLRAFAFAQPRGTIVVADCDVALADQTNAAYVPIAGSTNDGLHPVGFGANRMAGAESVAVGGLLSPVNLSISGQQTAFDATYNPSGNRLPSGQMIGTSGTAGTGVTGEVASGWSLSRTTGSTVTAVGSKVTTDAVTGKVAQRITLGGGSGANTEMISLSRNIAVGSGTYAVGDLLEGAALIEGSGLSRVRNIALRVSDVSPGGTIKYYGLNSSGNTGDRVPASLPQILIQTPEFIVQTGSTTLTIALEIVVEGTSAPAGTIDVSVMSIATPL